MGKRSRKRGGAASAPVSTAGSSRAERDAARARRAQAAARRESDSARSSRASTTRRRRGRPTIDERPPAPWGSFPLVELVVLLAIVLFVLSFVVAFWLLRETFRRRSGGLGFR